MGLFDSVKEKLSQDPPPLEEAIEEIAKRIRDDVMAGNYDEARNILEENLNKLESGEFEKAVRDDDGRYVGYEKSWPPPDEEAQQLTNLVFLELLELVVKDLETIEGQLEPPIEMKDPIKGYIELENGLEGGIKQLEQLLNSYTKEEVENMSRKRFKKLRKKGYGIAQRIRIALGTKNTSGGRDAVNTEKYRTNLKRNWDSDGKYRENMGVIVTVKMAERHLKFIKRLAEWENENYGLEIDQNEMKALNKVKEWLGERYEIVKELDDIIHPFALNKDAEAGITKDEAFKNPQESLQRLSKADQVLDKLHKLEEQEDEKIKKLDRMI